MPLWLDLLRTPMAAPETRPLRLLRRAWQALCLTSAAVVGFFSTLRHAIGRPAPIVAGALLFATLCLTWVYLSRKHRADTAFLDAAGGQP
jgi:hypothetical protein